MDPKPFTYEHFIQAVQSLKDDMLMYYIDELAPYQGMIHTITADNGKEFARNKDIAGSLGIQFFFAKPCHSWERGANENTNCLARQSIPKGSHLTPLEYFKKLDNFDYGSRCTSI